MKLFKDLSKYLSNITTVDSVYISLILSTTAIIIIFKLLKNFGQTIIQKKSSGRKEYIINQTYQITINVFEIIILVFIWDDYIKGLMTLISVISAAIGIASRDIILNFFCSIYIKAKKPFKVEDRIQIDDIKGDVTNISSLNFEILEVSTKEDNGQSTGVVVSFPNSIVLSKPIKNLNKGFKYIWNEITINLNLDCNLSSNKQQIYKIINNIDIVKAIPDKMRKQIENANPTNRIYYNHLEPVIYTKIKDNHIELNLRYLIHPKKARYVESVIWNKIYVAYKNGDIDLYTES
jgi:small-conductance mechanosensitive channel